MESPKQKRFKQFSEKKELNFKRCNHAHAEVIDGKLICPECGNAWTGPRLNELIDLLKERNLQTWEYGI